MDEKKMYYSFAKGNRGRWRFPVEISPSSAKDMQDDGVQIIPLEPIFIHTDTMKIYNIKVQGNTKPWLLPSPLEPEVAQVFREEGLELEETFNTSEYELVDGKFKEEPIKKEK